MKWVLTGLMVLGIALLSLGLYMDFNELSHSDLETALAPLLTVSGERIGSTPRSWRTKIPQNAIWKRLQQSLGGPDYLVAVVDNGEVVQCPSSTNVSVEVIVDRMLLSPKLAHLHPYGFSFACVETGWSFDAKPGSSLQLVLRSTGHKLATSDDVRIIPVWQASMKDKLVGRALADEFWTSWKVVSLLGSPLLATGLIALRVVSKTAKAKTG